MEPGSLEVYLGQWSVPPASIETSYRALAKPFYAEGEQSQPDDILRHET